MASVSLIKRTNPEREAALDQGWTRTSDKAQKRDQSDGPSHEPRQTTRLCLQDKGLFEARCQQCQGGSAFPDDGFCRKERNHEIEAGTLSWALSLFCLHLPQ